MERNEVLNHMPQCHFQRVTCLTFTILQMAVLKVMAKGALSAKPSMNFEQDKNIHMNKPTTRARQGQNFQATTADIYRAVALLGKPFSCPALYNTLTNSFPSRIIHSIIQVQ